jgi:hypothetical protein
MPRIHSILAAAFLFLLAPAPARPQEPKSNLDKLELYKRIRQSTVKVYSEFADGSKFHGTGVGYRRYYDYIAIITNSHVVAKDERERATSISVQPYAKGGGPKLFAYLLYNLEDEPSYQDIAVLVVRDPTWQIREAQTWDQGEDWKKAPVYACGHPQTEDFLIDDGNVLKTLQVKGRRLVKHDALIEHGNSGGGLFDGKGCLVAINTWLLDDGKTGIAFEIASFHREHGVGSFEVRSTHDGWSNATGLRDSTSVVAIAIGQWKSGEDTCGPGGFKDARDRAVYPEFNFGAALMRLGDQVKPFTGAHKQPNGDLVSYKYARIAAIWDSGGDLAFRINDRDVSDNSGNIVVFYVTTEPPREIEDPS